MRSERRWLRWLAVAAAGLVVLSLATWSVLETAWAEERIRRLIVDRASDALAADLAVERMSGSVFGDVTLSGVALTLEGKPVMTARAIRVRFRPFTMAREGLVFERVSIDVPRFDVVQDARGWNVARLTRPRPDGVPSSGPTVAIDRLEITGGRVDVQTAAGDVRRVKDLDLVSTLASGGGALHVGIVRATAIDVTSGLPVTSLTGALDVAADRISGTDIHLTAGGARLDARFDLPRRRAASGTFSATVERFPASYVRAWVPALTMIPASAVLSATAAGSVEQFDADWTLASADGVVTGRTSAAVGSDLWRFHGRVQARDWHPSAFFPELADLDRLNGEGTYDVKGPARDLKRATVSFDVTSPGVTYRGYRATGVRAAGTYRDQVIDARASGVAYHARVTTTARFEVPASRLTAQGEFTGVNIETLPAALALPALTSALSGRYTIAGSAGTWEVGAELGQSSLEGATVQAGSTARVHLAPDATRYVADIDFDGLDPARLSAVFPERAGWFGHLPGTVNASVQVDATGPSLDTLEGTTDVHIKMSRVAGVAVDDLHVIGTLADHRLQATVKGRVQGTLTKLVTWKAATGHPVTASADLDGQFAIPDVRVRPSLEDITASARLSLSNVAGFRTSLSRLELDASLDAGLLSLDSLEVEGDAIAAEAAGQIALAGPGRSDLTFTVTAADLEALSGALGTDAAGIASVSGRVTGDAGRTEVTGDIHATALSAGAVRVLSFSGTYSAVVPDLDLARASGQLDARSSFIEVGGTTLDQVTSRVVYENGLVEVDATLAQAGRTLDVSGQLRAKPEAHEIIVRRFDLTTAGRHWTLARPSATIRYGSSRIGVDDLVLSYADEEVSVDGALGSDAPRPLSVRLSNVDLAGVADWLPGAPPLTGRVNAGITVAGAIDDPTLVAEIDVGEGRVSDVVFRAFTADARYGSGRLTVAAELDAGPASTLTIDGTMPVGAGSTGPPVPYDLSIRSGELDLGLLQPFIPEVEGLRGTGRFDMRVTGTAPDVDGTMVVSGGRFDVPATGVAYENVTADLTVKGRELIVRALHLTDNDGQTAYIEGTVTVPAGGAAYGMDLRLVADDLDVLSNALGDVSLSAELQIMGDLQTPLVNGTIEVDRGRIEVDRILDQWNAAFEPIEVGGSDDDGWHSRASYSITLDLPDNVIVRGRGLRTRGGPVDLGDVNVTVGGALSLAKEVGEPAQVLGRLDVVRGTYQFQGRPFTIARGSSAQFRGDPFDPSLSVDAERTISGVIATVHVTGSPSRPEIVLSSDPPLDQGDVLSLIVFNQSMNRLPADQRVSLAARAGSLAAGAIATPIADSVANALNLDQFDIRASDVGGSASLVVGQQINERLFVGFRHDFGRSEASQVSFEYRLNEFLSIVTSLAQGASAASGVRRAEAAGFDLVFVVR